MSQSQRRFSKRLQARKANLTADLDINMTARTATSYAHVNMSEQRGRFQKSFPARTVKSKTKVDIAVPVAAAKVFALPELLEMVLLNLRWHNLFSLLRVNKTFRDTIQRSLKLRRRMHLEYKLPGDGHGITVPPYPQYINCSIVELLVANNILKFEPFEARHPFQPHKTFAPQYSHLIPALGSGPFKAVTMAIRSDVRKRASYGSWRKIKLTHEQQRFSVYVRIQRELTRPSYLHEGIHPAHHSVQYSEDLEFAEGCGTLGDIADVVEEMQRRTVDEHLKRNDQLMTERMEKAGYRHCRFRVR